MRSDYFNLYSRQKEGAKKEFGTVTLWGYYGDPNTGILLPKTTRMVALQLVDSWQKAYQAIQPSVSVMLDDLIVRAVAGAQTKTSSWNRAGNNLRILKTLTNAAGPELTPEQTKSWWDQLFHVATTLDDVQMSPNQFDLFAKTMGEGFTKFAEDILPKLPGIPSWALYGGIGLLALWLLKR